MMFTMLTPKEQVAMIQTWLDGIKMANVRAIINASGFNDENEEFQNNDTVYFQKSFIPHHWLFPQIAAVVHHGGAGTTHSGLTYGLPTLILPFGADQPFNGDRIRINNLGPAPIDASRLTASKFADAVQQLVSNDTFKRNAQTVAKSLADSDGVGECVKIITAVLRGERVTNAFLAQ